MSIELPVEVVKTILNRNTKQQGDDIVIDFKQSHADLYSYITNVLGKEFNPKNFCFRAIPDSFLQTNRLEHGVIHQTDFSAYYTNNETKSSFYIQPQFILLRHLVVRKNSYVDSCVGDTHQSNYLGANLFPRYLINKDKKVTGKIPIHTNEANNTLQQMMDFETISAFFNLQLMDLIPDHKDHSQFTITKQFENIVTGFEEKNSPSDKSHNDRHAHNNTDNLNQNNFDEIADVRNNLYDLINMHNNCTHTTNNKRYIGSRVHSVNLTTFHDSGRHVIRVLTQKCYADYKGNVVFSPLFGRSAVLDSRSDKISLMQNNKLVHGRRALAVLRSIKQAFGDCLYSIDPQLYQKFNWIYVSYESILLSRSPLKKLISSGVDKGFLESLYFNKLAGSGAINCEVPATGLLPFNISYYNKCQKNARKKALYHLKKGNTHKAINHLLGGHLFPKTIRQSLFTHPFYDKEVYDLVCNSILKIGVDNTKKLIIASADTFYLLKVLLLLSDLGFSSEKLLNAVERQDSLLIADFDYESVHPQANFDIVNMVVFLKQFPEFDEQIKVQSNHSNLNSYHDYIVQLYNSILYYTPEYDKPSLELLAPYHSSGYTIRSVINTNELALIGAKMNHCVATYSQMHYSEICLIYVLVDEDGNYHACIELDNLSGNDSYNIRQAKMMWNKPVRNNVTFNDLIKAWCEQAEIKINYHYCNDIQ